MAGTFNTAVREVFHELFQSLPNNKKRTQKQTLEIVGWLIERLVDWCNTDDSSPKSKTRENYWLAIAESALKMYSDLSGIDVDGAKRKAISLMIRRQAEYGPFSILEFGEKGVVVRAYDKYDRLRMLSGNDNSEPTAELWLETCIHAVIAVLLIRGYFELPLDYRDVQRLRAEVH